MDNNINQQVPLDSKQTPDKIANNLSFAKTLAYGFAIASVGIAIAIGGYLLGANKTKPQSLSQTANTPFVSPTPDPTANWQTYSHFAPGTVVGIEIKYPKGWGLKLPTSVNNFDDSLVYFLSNGKSSETEGQPYVYVRGLQDLSKPTFKNQVTSGLSEDLKNSFTYTKTSLNGYTLYKTESLPSRFGCQFGFFTKDEITYIEVSLCPYDSKKPLPRQDYYLNIYNQILSTFKFTDQDNAGSITVIPQNADMFEKTIVSEDGCNNPVGLVVYHDKVSDNWMKINSLKLQGNQYSREGLSDIVAFLNGGTLIPYQDLSSFIMAFREYCGGGYAKYIKELPNIPYLNVDISKTIMMYTGQQNFGGVMVVVLAKKGDEIIYLEHGLDYYNLPSLVADRNACGFENYVKTGSGGDEDCYRKALVNDKSLEKTSIDEAKKLINLFSI